MSVGSSARAGRSRRSSRYIVTSSDPTGTSSPSTLAMRSAIRRASGTPARRDAEQDQVAGALVALEDLVGDAGQRAGDVPRVEDRAAAGTSSEKTGSDVGTGMRSLDLLLRLTGRLVKGCRSPPTLPPVRAAARLRTPTPRARSR